MQRVTNVTILFLLSLLVITSSVAANEAVYQRVKRSTVWIVRPDGSSGSGVLVDADRRLVVTNAHVVGSYRKLTVFAPVNDTYGRIWRRTSYFRDAQRLGRLGYAAVGEVIAYSSRKDLAVVRLASNLRGLNEIELADGEPDVGDGLHVVGNPADRPLFTYCYGGARYCGSHSWTYDSGQYVHADVVTFSGHIWGGNSGGPVANSRGELVGVITGSNDTTGIAISLSEIKRLLGTVKWRSVFCIQNDTPATVYLAVRTAPEEGWERLAITAGRGRIWWGDDVSDVRVQFDWSFAEGYQGVDYDLDTYYVLLGDGVSAKPDQARQYRFASVRGGVNLYAK
ncbi:MAG: serine protease [Pirellulaceae bacterium]